MVSDIKKEKTVMMNIAKLTASPVLKSEDIKSEIMSVTPCPLVPVYLIVTRVYRPEGPGYEAGPIGSEGPTKS